MYTFPTEYSYAPLSTDKTKLRNQGLYTGTLSQGPEVKQTTCNIFNFYMALAMLGGGMTSVWGLLGLLINGYQIFRYESSLIKDLYTRDKYRRSEEHDDNIEEMIAQGKNRVTQEISFFDR